MARRPLAASPVPAAALAAFGALAAVLATACSFDYEQATVAEKLGEAPDSILQRFSQTVVRDGLPKLAMEAAEARIYRKSSRVVLTGARFREFDAEGKVAIEGQARAAVFHSDTENAELSGGIVLRSAKDKATLRAESLAWDRQRRVARSGAEEIVVVEKDDGSRIEGRGFEVDFRRHTVRFAGGVSGTVVTEDREAEP